ncbi:retrovirus-related Pol polyprotein from transposon opus [Trichonephila clavipes]|nr:retrovirus-related Pol polyprotein from transposon opus [Trichonephila clavipes]
MITDQLKRLVPGDVSEQFIDHWVKSIVPGDLADKLDEYQSVRANVKEAHSNDTRYRSTNNKFVSDNKGASLQPKNAPFFRKAKLPIESNTGTSKGFKPKCFVCENVGHLARECPKNTRTPPHNARSNILTAKGTELEKTKEVVTARVSISVSIPINTKNGIDDLQLVDIKCGQTSIKAVIDTGAQISVLREDLIDKGCGEGEGTIQIISAFGEKEIAALKLFKKSVANKKIGLKIDDGKHGLVPIMCAVSKKLVNDMLISVTAYEILLENVQLFDFENQRDFEGTKDKDIQLEREETLSALPLGQETDTSETNVAKSSFVKLQRMDESLRSVWGQAENKQNAYDIDDGVLVHMSQYAVKICKTCQLRRGLTSRDRIPITPIVRPENPFEVWSVDCIGPLEPSSRRGHKYIICAVDICTRWAQAVSVRNIKAKTTCEVLMRIFTQTGFPKTICTDQGTNFTAELTEAFKDVLGIAPRFATPGHPESMGAVERWNRTLKEMLNKNIQENVARIALRLPPFWKSNVRLWIAQCDHAFTFSGISSDDTKYSALVANLDAETLSYVSDIVLSPPNSDKYHTLSQRLITQFSDSETQKIKKLLTDLQLGDEKPSHLLRKMKELSNGQLQDDFLQSLWLQRMPPHIQTVLSASSEPLDKLAIIADKVSEVVGASSTICAATIVPPPSQSSSCSAQPTMDSLARQIQELSLQVAELTRERNSSRHQLYSSDRRRSHSRSRSVNRGSGICYYHRRYKEQARKCVSPCAFVQKNE